MLENLRGIEMLILHAMRLQKIKLLSTDLLGLEVVYPESIEKLSTNQIENIGIRKFKNLKHLYCQGIFPKVYSWFLPSLEHLREIHLEDFDNLSKLFQQKQQSCRPEYLSE